MGLAQICACLNEAGHKASIVHFGRLQYRKWSPKLAETQSFVHTMVLTNGRRVSVAWVPVPSEKELALLMDYVKDRVPGLVGISLTSVAVKAASLITRELWSAYPSLPIVWGGIEPTIEPERCLELMAGFGPSPGMVCLGEGENAMLTLCERLAAGESYADVPNIWLKHEGRLVRNKVAPLIQDLDSLPFPDYCAEHNVMIDNGSLKDYSFSVYAYEYDIMTSRGCPYGCAYCCNSQLRRLYTGQKYVRRKSVENVIEELKAAKAAYGIRYVRFHDDVFTGDREWLEVFVEQYKREIGLPFWCNTHPTHTSRSELLLLKEAGVDLITMGIQSGSNRVLKELYRRPGGPDAILETARAMADLGIRATYDIITNNALEEEADCRETFELLMNLPQPVRLNDGLNELSLFPNTPLTKRIEEVGRVRDLDMKKFAFWNRMYLLTHRTYRFIPRQVLWRLSRSKFLRRYPRLLSCFFLADHLKRLIYPFRLLSAKIFRKHP